MPPSSSPLVSVITPTLNQGQFLPQTIRSVARQTYGHVEHIVVDGGSTDGSVAYLRKAERQYGVRWSSGPDQGMYDGINKGMQLASGEILAYLNSDDMYLPWTLEVVTAAFARSPAADFVYGDALRLVESTGSIRPFFQHPFDRRHMTSSGSLIQPAVFWRRRVADSVGRFDSSLRFAADLDYWLRAADAGCRFRRVDELLAVDRSHDANLSATFFNAMASEIMLIRSKHRGGRRPTLIGRLHARTRREVWSRLLWLRFARERGRVPTGHRWPKALAMSAGPVSWPTALIGTLPLIGPPVQREFPWRSGDLASLLDREVRSESGGTTYGGDANAPNENS
jgi:glycosyltransferase involved in cell wall biosynthesis